MTCCWWWWWSMALFLLFAFSYRNTHPQTKQQQKHIEHRSVAVRTNCAALSWRLPYNGLLVAHRDAKDLSEDLRYDGIEATPVKIRRWALSLSLSIWLFVSRKDTGKMSIWAKCVCVAIKIQIAWTIPINYIQIMQTRTFGLHPCNSHFKIAVCSLTIYNAGNCTTPILVGQFK